MPRVLFVARVELLPQELVGALERDRGNPTLRVEHVPEVAGAPALLRTDPFDAVVVYHHAPHTSAGQLLEALNLASDEQPVLVVTDAGATDLVARSYELGAHVVLPVEAASPELLVFLVRRAIEQFHALRDNHRLLVEERRRLARDREEAGRLLEEQWHIARDVDTSVSSMRLEMPDGEAPLLPHYQDLLRTHVIMGSGNLSSEIDRLSELLAALGVPADRVLTLHLESVEHLIQGLGHRSTRHVLSRADLLVLELMVHLARRYQNSVAPGSVDLAS